MGSRAEARRYLAMAALALCLAAPARAGEGDLPGGGAGPGLNQFQLNEYGYRDQNKPRIAFFPDGRYVVVWENHAYWIAIWARVFDADGTPLTPEFHPNFNQSDKPRVPVVAVDPTSERFLVAWQSNVGAGTNTDIRGRLFEADGTPAPINVSQDIEIAASPYKELTPDLTALAKGGFFVVWERNVDVPHGEGDIEGCWIKVDGDVGTPHRINYYTDELQTMPAVAETANGEIRVVWAGSPQPDVWPPAPPESYLGIWGRYFDPVSQEWVPDDRDFHINDYTTNIQQQPEIAASPGGGFLVVWESWGAPGQSLPRELLGSNDFDDGSDLVINSDHDGYQILPQVSGLADGGFVVVWDSDESTGTDSWGHSIQGRRFSSYGSPDGEQFQVNSFTPGTQSYPAVAGHPIDDDFLIVWGSWWSPGDDQMPNSIQIGPCYWGVPGPGELIPCPADLQVQADLRVDNNRNGIVELDEPSEDENEDTWNATHGAIFLANIDSDVQHICGSSDKQLAACHDAMDETINGSADESDLARIRIVPWPDAPPGSSGYLEVSSSGSAWVRLFKRAGGDWLLYNPGSALSRDELQSGVEFALEGKDIVRDSGSWDGFLDVALVVDNASGGRNVDVVRLRLAPVIFHHHLQSAEKYYVNTYGSWNQQFRDDLASAAAQAWVPGHPPFYTGNDVWTQDHFEAGYMSMPGESGPNVIRVNFRSANFPCFESAGGEERILRPAGRLVFTSLAGPGVAGAVEYDPADPSHDGCVFVRDTLNSFGNLETIPPYALVGGANWPLGRVLRGRIEDIASEEFVPPDQAFDGMVRAQGMQGVIYIDTGWLAVKHVDETLSFIKAETPLGWAVLVNDPLLAKSMFEDLRAQGFGTAKVFEGTSWETTVDGVLDNVGVMIESSWAAVKVQAQISSIEQTTGLDLGSVTVQIPFLHTSAGFGSYAYQPGTVNGTYLNGQLAAQPVFAVPDPHGPEIAYSDPFEDQLEFELGLYGITPFFVEDWDYHVSKGEVHCGSNVSREIPTDVNWWETGR